MTQCSAKSFTLFKVKLGRRMCVCYVCTAKRFPYFSTVVFEGRLYCCVGCTGDKSLHSFGITKDTFLSFLNLNLVKSDFESCDDIVCMLFSSF